MRYGNTPPPLIERKYRYIVFNNEGSLLEFDDSWVHDEKCKPNKTLKKNETKRAKLFIYRTNPAYHRFNPEKTFIYVDGNRVGKLGNGQAISTTLKAGNHIVTVKDTFFFMPFTEVGKLQFNAELNKEYYIRYDDDGHGSLSFEFTNKIYYLKRL